MTTSEMAGAVRARTGDRISYGAVHLDVTDLARSVSFWRDTIGLSDVGERAGGVGLGAGGRTLVVLHPGATRRAARGHAGLYHVAIHVPDAQAFARTLARLVVLRIPQSPTDHVFSKATYLHDPDGIMLELTLETPERFRSLEVRPDAVVIYDSEGRERQATDVLDVQAALEPLGDDDPMSPMADGSYVGHVHLHVPELSGALEFYRDVVGFTEHAVMHPYGMADMSAGGVFPHRIAMNTWNGPRARQAAAGTAGMRMFELIVADPTIGTRLGAWTVDGDVPVSFGQNAPVVMDPAGNRVAIGGPMVASAV
jgi:catechol 2,3-dioxygenase